MGSHRTGLKRRSPVYSTAKAAGLTWAPLEASEIDRYLEVLRVAHETPSEAALRRLVRAHLTRIPFENISKLFRLKHEGFRSLPALTTFLDGISRFNFGGTCYTNNIHFHRLLCGLGYEAALCGADMESGEDVHAAIIVSLDGRAWLVDAGYAAPFLDPLPLDLEDDHVLCCGNDCYVLHPRDRRGNSRLDLWRDGERLHGYLLKPTPRAAEYFGDVIAASFRDEATFLNAVLIVRCWTDRVLRLYNLSVTHATATSQRTTRLESRRDLPATVERLFAIPASIVDDAIADLEILGTAYG